MSALSNPRWEQFAHLIADGALPSKAYVTAGFSKNGAAQSVSRLLRNPEVAERIRDVQEQLRASAVVHAGVTRKNILERLDKIAKVAGDPSERIAYNPSAANRALELMGKELGMFTDRVDVRDVSSMTPEQVLEKLKQEEARLASMKASIAAPDAVSGVDKSDSVVQ